MAILSFNNVSKYYMDKLVLDHVSLVVNSGEKVALIGDNGSGKTTIMKLILREEEPTLMPKEDKPGEISLLGGIKVGYLDQNAISDVSNTVEKELLTCFQKTIEIGHEIEVVSKKIAKNPIDKGLGDRYDRLLKRYEETHGYTYLNEIDEMLSKFGFDKSIEERVISSLSGGERMKIAFVKILLFDYDFLLLDEPTNHLDISTIERLEGFLKSYKGTILFVSHDRYFLETLADKVIELVNHQVKSYNMDYDHYLEQKEKDYNTQLKEAKLEEREIEKLKRFIEFYKPKPRFTSRAKDREKKLAKLEKNMVYAPKKEDKSINFSIGGSNLKNKLLFEFDEVSIGYDNKPLVPKISFKVYGKDRLAICGDNGIGKTTLLKSIIGDLVIISGKIREFRELKFGYIKQNDYVFKSGIDAVGYIRDKYPSMSPKEIRDVLGRFQFKGEDALANVDDMSNGEKMRLILCSLSLSGYDVLLLDEPTNHLDMVTKESLIKALNSYGGCIIFVSHDRYFIDELATEVLYLSKDDVIFLEGNYEDLKRAKEGIAEEKLISIKEVEKSLVREKPKKLSNNKVNELKEEMAAIEKEITDIDEKLEADFTSYSELDELSEKKDELEHRYLEIMDILEKDSNIVEL
jgi:ATP-binding cassette subfamily F protein 3